MTASTILHCGFQRKQRSFGAAARDCGGIARQVLKIGSFRTKAIDSRIGEHPRYDADFIAEQVRTVYSTRQGARRNPQGKTSMLRPWTMKGLSDYQGRRYRHYQIFQEPIIMKPTAAFTLQPEGNYRIAWTVESRPGIRDATMGDWRSFGLYDWRFRGAGPCGDASIFKSAMGRTAYNPVSRA